MKIHFPLRSLLAILALPIAASANSASFDFTLAKPALTSAGVYDADGTVVRVLWTMEKLDAGKFSRQWDGKDDLGNEAPAGAYSYKVVANRSTYTNVGAIGNSGLPPDAHDHTPTHIAAIAVDDEGSVYSANGWDEAGADFKKWDKNGKSLFDANFSIRNGHPNGAPYAIAVDDKYIYCSVGGWANSPWNEAQQIQRFDRTDGKPAPFTKTGREDGHIQVYEWPSKMIPNGTPEKDAELMKYPLRALAVDGPTLFVADYLENRVIRFNKTTGEKEGEIKVNRPMALARGPDHFIHIEFEDGTKLGSNFAGLSVVADRIGSAAYCPDERDASIRAKIVSLAATANGSLYEANENGGFDTVTSPGGSIQPLGIHASPGDRAADHFFKLTSVAVDKDGDIFTAQDEPYGGARLAKWSPDHKLLWENFGCEFVSLGNYGVADPDAFYSMTFHDYRLLDHNAGKWEYTGNGSPFPERRYYSDVHGTPRVLKLGEHSFYFLPSGDGVQVYRLDDHGKVFHPAALLGGRSPAPDGSREARQLGQWTWHDADGSGQPKPEQIAWFKQPGQGHYSCFGMDVDAAGNIIFANTETHGIWTIPIGALDASGNPTYDWSAAREMAKDTSPMKFDPTMAQRAEDGSFYAFGWSQAWPQPKNNPFWMGGTTVARFDKDGKLLWAAPTPKLVVGLDVIPGGKGGCFVGEGKDARLDHYMADGLLIGSMQPGAAMSKETGWLDNHASVAVNRDRRDGVIDVFAEDDYVLRIGWYRVNDGDVETMSGKLDVSR